MKIKNKIQPIGFNILIETKSVEIGELDTSSTETAIEEAIVIEIGNNVAQVKKGDKIFVKGWAVDTCITDGIKYRFVDERTGGIKAVIK